MNQEITHKTYYLILKENGSIDTRVLAKKKHSIGRSPANDIQLVSRGISRYHATIYFSEESFWIIDGDFKGHVSTNGIFVNGIKVTVHRLKQHDVIAFQKGVYGLFLPAAENSSDPHTFGDYLQRLINFVASQQPDEIITNRAGDSEPVSQGTVIRKIKNPYLDDLTELPNRSSFLNRLQKSIEFKAKISKDYNFAVLFIDLDRFKVINDSLGHLAGDKFLIGIAERLQHCLRQNDMVGRLGGDEFAILLHELNSAEEAITIAKRLQQILSAPLDIEGNELYPSVSIGIALSFLGYQTVEDIMRDADTAMYQAKNTGRSRFVVFDEVMHSKASELFRLETDLRKAIENQELYLQYQPIVSLSAQAIVGFEALVRWHHPEKGTISPDVFIPIAEETNLIHSLGTWVLDEACSQLSQWKQNSSISPSLFMHVNVSSKQLSDANLADRLLKLTRKYELEPEEIKLEVTETILMENFEGSIDLLQELNQAGFQLAIDDFGTGYSSLSYLSKFPIDALKIDKSFVAEIDTSAQNTSMNVTNSVIGLAHSIGVKVIAEGIESAYHLVWLQHLKCDYGQGFLFAKPLMPSEATQLAEQGLDWKWR
jgi:diguanylate cyclase (GGDEF)-like protein